MKYERCDVVYGADPFKGEHSSRPWLVISNDTHPFHGDQYIVLALTTKTWHQEFIPIAADDWVDGGTPKSSSVIPWSVETIEQADIDFWQGTLAESLVTEAVSTLASYVHTS